jgi:NAD-dependent SIR2 family protein deacetylase
MPRCTHCGSHVSEDWKRVMGVEGDVVVCPHCEDRYPDPDAEGLYSEYMTSRSAQADNGRGPRTYDPDFASAGGDA